VVTAKAERPHYLPASLIGGFGEPGTGKNAASLRYAKVCVRRRDNPDVLARAVRADNVAVQNGLYDVGQPGPELPADFAENLWRQYEGPLPAAIKALEAGRFTQEDWLAVLLHIQAQSIRHPDFDRQALDYIARNETADPGRDHIQIQRQRTHEETRQWMARARFAVLRHRKLAQRFLINDKGYVPLHDVGLDLRGVVFPLSGMVAVLMVIEAAQPDDDYEQGPQAERALNPKGMAIINEATWDTVGIKCVIGHPDDMPWIAELRTGPIRVVMPGLGPYWGNREPGLFDWALPQTARSRRSV